nr:immunoglobulin light chain junction region [Macaca mulatta]
CQHYYDNSCSF